MLSAKEATPLSNGLRGWPRRIKCDVHALYLAARDPRVPWHAKAVALSVAAYALSPIDLIPDFIPVLGHLDDLIIVPLGIWLAVRLIPADVLKEHRAAARQAGQRPVNKTAEAFTSPSALASASSRPSSRSANSLINSPHVRKGP